MRTERLLFGPMVTPLPRRRPQVLARQAASLAVLSGGRFVLGLGLGDDWVGEFSAFGDEPDPKVRGRMLDEGLAVLTGLLGGETVDHEGTHYAARDVRFLPAPRCRSGWPAASATGRPLRRAAWYDGFFVIGLDGPADLDTVTADLAAHEPGPGFDVVVDLQPDQDPGAWVDRGARGCSPGSDRTTSTSTRYVGSSGRARGRPDGVSSAEPHGDDYRVRTRPRGSVGR